MCHLQLHLKLPASLITCTLFVHPTNKRKKAMFCRLILDCDKCKWYQSSPSLRLYALLKLISLRVFHTQWLSWQLVPVHHNMASDFNLLWNCFYWCVCVSLFVVQWVYSFCFTDPGFEYSSIYKHWIIQNVMWGDLSTEWRLTTCTYW